MISFYKLIKLVSKNKQPQKVKWDNMIFEFYFKNYRRYGNNNKESFLSDYLSMEDMYEENIEIVKEEK